MRQWMLTAALVLGGTGAVAKSVPDSERARVDALRGQASVLRTAGLERSGIARVALETASVSGLTVTDARTGQRPPVAGEILRVYSRSKFLELFVGGVAEELPGVLSYAGHVKGDDDSSFTLTVNQADQSVVGKVHEGGTLHLLQGRVGEGLTLSEIEVTQNVQDPADDEVRPSKSSRAVFQKAAQGGNVRMLLVYGDDVPARVGNIATFAANFVAEINLILGNSGVSNSNYVSLAGVESAGNTWRPPVHGSTLTKDHVINRMTNDVGEFSTLSTRMDALKADIAVGVMSADDASNCPGSGCAVGRVGGIANTWLASDPFAVVADTYVLGDLSGPHEVGHVLGGAHHNDSSITPQPYSKGKLVSNTWITVMGAFVNPSCPFYTLNNVPTCPRIPRFSNPSVSWGGTPTGDAGVADMASALALQMPVVANYSSEGPSTVGPVGSLTFSQSGTFMTLSWTAAAGSPTSYQVEQAEHPAPVSNPVYTWKPRLYSGPNLSTTFLVKFGTYFSWRVRGCNSAGCGPWTQLGFVI